MCLVKIEVTESIQETFEQIKLKISEEWDFEEENFLAFYPNSRNQEEKEAISFTNEE